MVLALRCAGGEAEADLVGIGLDLAARLEQLVPGLGDLVDAGLGHDVGVVDHGPGVGRERHAVNALAVVAIDQVGGDEVLEALLADALLLDLVVDPHAGFGGAQILDPDEGEVDHVRAATGRRFADELVARILERDPLEVDGDAGILRLERVEPGADLVDVVKGVAEGEVGIGIGRSGQCERCHAQDDLPCELHLCPPDGFCCCSSER